MQPQMNATQALARAEQKLALLSINLRIARVAVSSGVALLEDAYLAKEQILDNLREVLPDGTVPEKLEPELGSLDSVLADLANVEEWLSAAVKKQE